MPTQSLILTRDSTGNYALWRPEDPPVLQYSESFTSCWYRGDGWLSIWYQFINDDTNPWEQLFPSTALPLGGRCDLEIETITENHNGSTIATDAYIIRRVCPVGAPPRAAEPQSSQQEPTVGVPQNARSL
jgi:hypothetical protein